MSADEREASPDHSTPSLTVLSIAYPLAPVSRDAVGGAEQVLAALDRALVENGHRSIVIACAGSTVRGELIEIPAPGTRIDAAAHVAAHAACRRAIAAVLARDHVDLVHMHGVDFYAYLPPPPIPVLATLHLPIASYPSDVFERTQPGLFMHCVSTAQAQHCARTAALLPPIANGVDLEELRPGPTPGTHAAVLGRICREKGQHLALDAATRAQVPLVLAGRVFAFAEHERYFTEGIAPRLDSQRRFVGAVAGARKVELLATARCLVVPSVIEETSSLVAMEALACGTPVIAFRRGAVPDLIEHGVTGFVVDGLDGLAAALRSVHELDRARCRAVAEERCARDRMCFEYLTRYQAIVRGTRSAETTRVPRVSNDVQVAVVDGRGLERLVPAWSALWARCPDATIFQSPDWLLPWCQHLLGGRVESLAAWRDDVLVGLVPLFRWRDGDAEVLSLLGAGVSDYLDALLDPRCDGLLRSIEQALACARWDRVELSELRGTSRLLALELGGDRVVLDQEPCPALQLVPGLPGHGVAPRVQRELEYQHRRAGRELVVGREVVPADVVGALAQLHGARWSARGEGGALAASSHRAFLTGAVDRLAARDAVVVTGVRFGRDLAALALGFLDHDAVRYYLGGFDPDHRTRSPGTLAIGALVDEAARRGATSVDFLRGAEPYKYRFGARDAVHLHRVVVTRRP